MPDKKSIFLMGDSLIEDYGEEKLPLCGWGKYFPEFVKDGIEVRNYSHSGWTTKSFLTKDFAGLYPGKSCFEVMLDDLKSGDTVLVFLGVNDASLVNEMRTSEDEYRKNLTYIATEIRKKGADLIFGTLSLRGGADGSELGWNYQLPPDDAIMDDSIPMDERWMRRTKVLCETAKDLDVLVLPFGEELKKVYEDMFQDYMKNNSGASIVDGRNYVRYYFHLYNKAINTPKEDGGLGCNLPDREDDSTHLCARGAYVYAKVAAKLIKNSETEISDFMNL